MTGLFWKNFFIVSKRVQTCPECVRGGDWVEDRTGKAVGHGRDGASSRGGTGEFSLPHVGIVRPFSFFLREVRIRFRVAELHAVH